MRRELARVYCLDCGTKIAESESQCPRCGSLVSEMKERIAQAEEMITYTDAVFLSHTAKLPLVADRVYRDKDGNLFDPSKEVDVDTETPEAYDLSAIPEIGASDPYITMPMQRIVSNSGEVVADVDHEAKAFLQSEETSSRSRIIVIVAVVLVVLVLVCGYLMVSNHWFDALLG